MDCNSYSYMSMDGTTARIAEVETENDIIYFDEVCDFFQDHYFTVDCILSDRGEFFEYRTSDNGESRAAAYKAATAYYNSLVADHQKITA